MPGVEPRLVVAVVGGGRMGAGIAQVCLTAGHEVAVVEQDPAATAAAEERIRRGLAIAIERGSTHETMHGLTSRLMMLGGPADLPPNADLVVEAVPEDAAIKADVLTRVDLQGGAAQNVLRAVRLVNVCKSEKHKRLNALSRD